MTGLFDHYFNESHVQFRAMCKRFTEEEISPFAHEWEEAGLFPRELYRKAADAGILAPSWPERFGGGGGDVFHDVVFGEELIAGGSTGVVVGLNTFGIALPPILQLGTAQQQERFIPPVLRGELIAALAITEPDTGSDVARVRTRAVRDGAHYVLDGAKTFITSGVRADLVLVLARTGEDPHLGLSFFVVEAGTPGFSVSRSLKKTGWWASDTAELHFEGCRIPAENRIGAEGEGFVALMNNFEAERLGLAVNGHAIAQVCLDEAAAYAKQRKAFGRPIEGFQVIRHKLANMATSTTAAKSLTYACARKLQAGQPAMTEIAMAKNFAGKVAIDVCYEAVQILGGLGYMRESKVERLSRDARLLPIGGGTHEIMNELIFRGL
jgi:acyl-CoA dehydrogenase